jgi:hypothetical protein
MAMYLGKAKIGYSSYSETPSLLNGKKVTRSDSLTVMNMGLLGADVKIQMRSQSWTNTTGKPLQMAFTMESAGRTQQVFATFSGNTAHVAVTNGGQKSTRTLTVPKDGAIGDDVLALVRTGKLKPGAKTVFYVLDPSTVAFQKNEAKFVGKVRTEVGGKAQNATLIEVNDSRAVTRMYLDPKGDPIRITGPMGIEILPVSKAIALAPPGKYAPSVDLALVTSIKTDKPINDPEKLTGLKIRFEAQNIRAIPSGDFQTAKREGGFWLIDVHPPQLTASEGKDIAQAAAEKPEWTKPSLHIPSSSSEFKALAKKIIGDETNVQKAALALQGWVNAQMQPNAGIGVLRDATEVLKTKEGVCRDYAILTVTLLRAAGIPAKLVSGIVNWDGAFYYHAWAEAWDGTRWLGIDSTVEQAQISAAHVKLGEGNVEDAFNFSFLDRAKIQVLGQKRN